MTSKVQKGSHGHGNPQALKTHVNREGGYRSMVDMKHSSDAKRTSLDNPYSSSANKAHGAGNDTVKNHH